MNTEWDEIKRGNGERHYLPHGEVGHCCTPECWCGPFLDDGIWVHTPSNHEKKEKWN